MLRQVSAKFFSSEIWMKSILDPKMTSVKVAQIWSKSTSDWHSSKNIQKKWGSQEFKMSELRSSWRFGGRVHIKRNQVLLMNKASKIHRNLVLWMVKWWSRDVDLDFRSEVKEAARRQRRNSIMSRGNKRSIAPWRQKSRSHRLFLSSDRLQ